MATLGPFSHILVPAGKAGKIYFAKDVAPYFDTADFSRPNIGATSGATVYRNGELIELAENEPDWSEPISGGCPRLLMRPQAQNLFLNSETLSTQNVTVTAVAHTVSFKGTGTITFSGARTGSLVGTGAEDIVSATFTPTAGTVTCTVTGSVLEANFILGSIVSTWIPTVSTAVTRSANAFEFTDLVTKGVIGSGNVFTILLEVDFKNQGNIGTNSLIWISDTGGSETGIQIQKSGTNNLEVRYRIAGGSYSFLFTSVGSLLVDGINRIAFSSDKQNHICSVNGSTVFNAAVDLSAMNQLLIIKSGSLFSNPANADFVGLGLVPLALNEAQLNAETA